MEAAFTTQRKIDVASNHPMAQFQQTKTQADFFELQTMNQNLKQKLIREAILFSAALCLCCVMDVNVLMSQTTAYVGATIETMGEDGQIENATMVVSDEKITEVGDDVDVPDDARVVDMNGKFIVPGVVDPYFVFKTSAANSSRTVVFRGRTFTIPGGGSFSAGPFIRVGEYFDPINFNFGPARRSGITTANLVSDGRGLSAFANLSDDISPEMLFNVNGKLFAKITNQTSALDVIRKPLEPPKKKPTKKSTSSDDSEKKPTPAEELKKMWEDVQEGKSPIFVNLNNEASVAYLLQFAAKKEKLKIVLVATGPNLYQSLDKIAENENITIVLQPGIDTVPFSRDLMNVARMLAEKEIPFSISMSLSRSQLVANQDDPMFPLAMLVKTGLDREQALKSVTIDSAKVLGIEETHGSLEDGKHANFLVFDGDPLQTGVRLQQVYLNGSKVHEN